MNYKKLFEEVRDLLAGRFEEGGVWQDAMLLLNEEGNNLRICKRDNEKVVYGAMHGLKYHDRVEIHTRDPKAMVRRFTVLKPVTKLVDALHEEAIAGRDYYVERTAELKEDKRRVTLAQEHLTAASIPNGSNFLNHDRTGPHVWVEPSLTPGRVNLNARADRYNVECWPEHAVLAAHSLLAFLAALDEFHESQKYWRERPAPTPEEKKS